MSKLLCSDDNNPYIRFNCLISICHVLGEDSKIKKNKKYLVRKENFSSFLVFKQFCTKNYDYLNISDSLFYIRDVEECKSIYGNNNKDKENSIVSTETHFSKNHRLYKKTNFYLQHMMTKKFVSCVMNFKNNKITLKLENEVESAYTFSLEKVNKIRSTNGSLKFNQIFYLKVNVKEDNTHYYVDDNIYNYKNEFQSKNIIDEIESDKSDDDIIQNSKIDYNDTFLNRKPLCELYLINQSSIINNQNISNNTNNNNIIYSGQLINIIFTNKNKLGEKDEKIMLCLRDKNKDKCDKNINKLQFKKKVKINQESFEVSACAYSEKLCDQVINNALWVIENDSFFVNGILQFNPVQIKNNIRIRNALTGYYLNINPKSFKHFSNNIKIITKSSIISGKHEYEFNLVKEKSQQLNLFFQYNLRLYHNTSNDESKYAVNEGKYYLKGIFQNIDKENVFEQEVQKTELYFKNIEDFYVPVSLELNDYNEMGIIGSIHKSYHPLKKNEKLSDSKLKNKNKKYKINVKTENDFIFSLYQIDIFKGSQVIYIQKIILGLENDLQNNNINLITLNEKILFLFEYLINIDYSSKDKNQEINVPIKERQTLLWKFNIVNIIVSYLDYSKLIIESQGRHSKYLDYLLVNIKKFFKYLSKNEEEIKISIYVLALEKMILLDEKLSEDTSKLVYFIFDLVHNSEKLQTYLIGETTPLINYIKNDPFLSKMNIDINKLPNKEKIFELIETNTNFLHAYQNLLILNKVQYKREEILNDIKKHIEKIMMKKKEENESKKDNYVQIMENSYENIKKIIKNNAILINNFLTDNVGLKNKKTKKRGFGFPRLSNVKNALSLLNKNTKSSYFKEDKKIKEVINKKSTVDEEINLQHLVSKETNNNLLTKGSNEETDLTKYRSDEVGFGLLKEKKMSSVFPIESERNGLLISPNPTNRFSTPKGASQRFTLGINKKFNSNRMSNIKFITETKTRRSAISSEEKLRKKNLYRKTLEDFGRVWAFIKLYKNFRYKNLFLLLENILKTILNDKDDTEEKPLYYFIDVKKDSTFLVNNLRVNTSTKVTVLYLLKLFNHIFQMNKTPLEEKIERGELKAQDLLEDIMNEKLGDINDIKLDDKYSKIDNGQDFDDNLEKDKYTIDEQLSVFYSTYQFDINKYVKLVHNLLNKLRNCLINIETFESIKSLKKCFLETLKILLSKITFLNDNTINFLYLKVKKNPSILGGAFNYKQLTNHIFKLNHNYKKMRGDQTNNNFLIQEQILIDYLYSMCKECDEIKYFYEKITTLKYIREFIFSRKPNQDSNNEEELNKKFVNQMKKIMKLIWEKKKIPILEMYNEYNDKTKSQLTEKQKKKLSKIGGNKFEQVDFWENYFYECFKVGDIAKFILRLIKLYEVDEFFGGILYFERVQNEFAQGQEDKSIKKIRKLITQISKIEKKVEKLKKYSVLEDSEKDNQIIKNNDSITSKRLIDNQKLYYCLGKIQSTSLEVFNFDLYGFKSENFLYKMLIEENRTFYMKIDFLKSIRLMIQAIDYFQGDIWENNLLGYIANLLRIFSKIISLYPNFHLTLKNKENLDRYIKLMKCSFNCISKFSNDYINLKIESVFLEIMYRALDIFLYIIQNSNMHFQELREFMESIFSEIQDILPKFRSIKNRFIYRLLYLFGICRILLYLYNDKTHDSSSYNQFYRNIFKISDIDKYFFNNYGKEKTNLNQSSLAPIEEEGSIRNESNRNSNRNSNKNLEIQKKQTLDIFDIENFQDENHPLKLEDSQDDEEEVKNFKTLDNIEESHVNNYEENKDVLINEQLEWYDEKEIEKLSFYVSFLLLYSFYLNEKNSIMKVIDREENDDDEIHTEEISLENLFKKINDYLSHKNNPDNDPNKANNSNENFSSINSNIYSVLGALDSKKSITDIKETTVLDFSYIEKNSSELSENELNEKNEIEPQHLFIFALLQSIVNFKHSSSKHTIEIPIKFNKPKIYDNSDSEEIIENENESLFDKNSNHNSIVFYYYEPSHIDIILLEKIIIEISLKRYIKNFCLELSDEENESKDSLFEELLKNLNYYKLIYNYKIKEYNLVNNLFVKNNMALLIKKLLTLFKSDDLKEITQMSYFMYKKMEEVYSFEQVKPKDDDQTNISLIDFLQYNAKFNKYDYKKIDILPFLKSLIYINQKHERKICLILYKIGFELIKNKYTELNILKKEQEIEIEPNFNSIIKIITELFKQESCRNLIEDEYVFKTMLISLIELLKFISDKDSYLSKNFDLFKEFMNSLDFILGHLSKDYVDIENFMKRPENLFDSKNFLTNKNNLVTNLEFFITLLILKKKFKESVLKEDIIDFGKEIIKRTIRLIKLILEVEKEKSIEIINILIEFLFNFIKGPDINNLKIIFALGFFDLVSYVITNIDYYKLFLNYVNKENMHQMIDNYIKIECKILKIFIIYYNISFSPKSKIEEFDKVQQWYKNNFKKIVKKLKKIFYMSEKEMEGREYDLNKMLLSIKVKDNYTKEEMCKRNGKLLKDTSFGNNETNINNNNGNQNNKNDNNSKKNENTNNTDTINSDSDNSFYSTIQNDSNLRIISEFNKNYENDIDIEIDINKNENQSISDFDNGNNNNNKSESDKKENKKEIKKIRDYCIIKFDLFLVYYSLYNYHKDLSEKEDKYKFSKHKNFLFTILYAIFSLIYDFGKFIFGAISLFIPFMYYFFRRFQPKNKKDVDFLQDLQNIEDKCEIIKEEQIINFLRNYIRKVEVSVENIIFKVYFPMIDKANTLLNYRKEYLKVEELDSSDFINFLLNQYDYIYIRTKENSKINKWIGEIPVINYIVRNLNIFGLLLIYLGLGSTFIIINSFNTFTSKIEGSCGKSLIYFRYAKSDERIQCPRFAYSSESETRGVVIGIFCLIMVQCIIQGLIFIDYSLRTIFIESEVVSFEYKMKKIKENGMKANLKFSKFGYIYHIIIPTFFRCIFNFKTLYYLISLTMLIASCVVHPFFNCVILLELVNRVQVMQNILKAMYRPSKNILIILLMFIILEYFFSIIAQSYFTTHFPNISDTKNFLNIFMRMIDETFKQDGGIGTYLDKSLDSSINKYVISKTYLFRFFFDLLFFLVVLLLVFQMFLSVIIDYFNETREKSETFNDTMETECIVCGISREEIEKTTPNDKKAFDRHITYCHNVFNYIYYLMYLHSITDRDVIIDDGVWNLHLDKNLSYLPKNKFFKNLERERLEKYNSRNNEENT